MKLRPYQREAIDAIRDVWDSGQQNALLVLATGLGKTVVFTALGRELRAEGIGKTLVLAHRGELLEQAKAKWLEVEPDAIVGVVKGAQRETWADVIVASVQSCYPDALDEQGQVVRKGRVSELPLAEVGLVIADECHHIAADSWLALVRAVRQANPRALLLGVTATPYRADGQGLGMLFDRIAYRLGIADGIAQGYLCPLRGVRVQVELDLEGVKTSKNGDYRDDALGDRLDHEEIHRAIVEAWRKEAEGRQTVCFSPTVDTATHLAEAFVAAGIPADVVSDRTKKKDRAAILARYAAGELRVICNCAVLTEGWDAPATSCVVLARPTKSVGLYAQCVGRGTRLAEGKVDCVVLDVVGATALGLASLADLSEGKEGRAPGIDAEPEEEEEEERGGGAPVPDVRTVQVKGVSTYEVDLFGGAVAWARVRGARVASLDIGHSVICYALQTGEWYAEAYRGGGVVPIARGEEREVLTKAEQYAQEHGKRHFMLPSEFLARRPASEKQVSLLTTLIQANRRVDAELAPKRPLRDDELPSPAALSMPAAGHWITYLRARLKAAKGRK